MAKATIKLASGSLVVIEGTTAEVRELLEFYSRSHAGAAASKKATSGKGATYKRAPGKKEHVEQPSSKADLSEIVGLIKNCDEAEKIGAHVLDRTSQVDRILLPLYIVHEHLGNAFGLTSGEISKVTKELGIPIQTPNVSNNLSVVASRYVVGDKMRRHGQPVRYKLTRRGLKYIKSVIKGTGDAK